MKVMIKNFLDKITPTSIGWVRLMHRSIISGALSLSQSPRKDGSCLVTNVLLGLGLALFLFWIWLVLHSTLAGSPAGVIPLHTCTATVLIAAALYILAKRGYCRLAGYSTIILFFLGNAYVTLVRGGNHPANLLCYGIITLMAGILFGPITGCITAGLSITTILALGIHGYMNDSIPEWGYWRLTVTDLVFSSVLIGLITALSWISSRNLDRPDDTGQPHRIPLHSTDIDKDLPRRRHIENLSHYEQKRICELYRFAEFGKLSAGIFHDLFNSLTAISMATEKMEQSRETGTSEEASAIKTALSAARRMEYYIASVKRHISPEQDEQPFDPVQEIKSVIEVMAYRARKSKVSLSLDTPETAMLYGSPVKFCQVVTNLVSNAIDSYAKQVTRHGKAARAIRITFLVRTDMAVLLVTDQGCGIPHDILPKIWQPFFTTKEGGTGLGLATTKSIIEDHFCGTIAVENGRRYGTRFRVTIPLSRPGNGIHGTSSLQEIHQLKKTIRN